MVSKTALIVSAALAATLGAAAWLPLATAGETELVPIDASQQDEARDAVKQGLVRPLEEVLTEVRKTVKGDIVEIEFEKDDGRFIYEIEYVAPDGHLMEIKIDAKTLAVVSIGPEDED